MKNALLALARDRRHRYHDGDRTRRNGSPLHALLTIAALAVPACAGPEEGTLGDEALSTAAVSSASTLADLAATQCSTAPARPLSTEIVVELQCLHAGLFDSIADIPRLQLGPAAHPWLQTPAAKALRRAAARRPGVTLGINHALRSPVQQYLLRHQRDLGRCGITAAAAPGSSNHEDGLGIDVQDAASWREALEAEGFEWFGPGDTMHFDYKGSGTRSVRRDAVRIAQRYWNLAHPEDAIDEDGSYGPATARRFGRMPVGGFGERASCDVVAEVCPSLPEVQMCVAR